METRALFIRLCTVLGTLLQLDGPLVYVTARATRQITCLNVSLVTCHDVIPSGDVLVHFPNVLGHYSQGQVRTALKTFAVFMKDQRCGPHLQRFLCHLMAAPCTSSNVTTSKLKLPCRESCTSAESHCLRVMRSEGLTWPSDFQCSKFPQTNCLYMENKEIYHKEQPNVNLANEAKTHNDSIKMRRYDIADLGEVTLFQGWADVQGQGAANDYCRIIGKTSKTRFMSCRLAGSSNDVHKYVSVRGLDVGHRGTWFMKDMDGDGRDDYCRCVGRGVASRMSCMKSGNLGFYGSSSSQPGSQYTFDIPGRSPCVDTPVNVIIGIPAH